MKDKLLKIVNHYGINKQQRKLEEEIFELQEAIFDVEHNKQLFLNHIEEEFADVMVILEQFKTYYKLDNDVIVEIMEKKIDRQLERIENE